MFSFVDISILVHATEDENKILNHTLESFKLSTHVVTIDRVKTEGHWKNPIVRLNITTSFDIDRLYDHLCTELRINYGSSESILSPLIFRGDEISLVFFYTHMTNESYLLCDVHHIRTHFSHSHLFYKFI